MILFSESTSSKWPSKQQTTATIARRVFSSCHCVFHYRNSPYVRPSTTWCFLTLRSFVGISELCASKFEINKLGTFCFWHAYVFLSYSMCLWPPTAHFFCKTHVPFFAFLRSKVEKTFNLQGENAPLCGVQNFVIGSTVVGWDHQRRLAASRFFAHRFLYCPLSNKNSGLFRA